MHFEKLASKNTAILDDSRSAAPSQHDLLTVEELSELLKVPVSWVYQRTRQRGLNRLPGFRLGKYWRFRKSDVLAWLDRQQCGGRANG
jgi:excisionase family DNA binding protein